MRREVSKGHVRVGGGREGDHAGIALVVYSFSSDMRMGVEGGTIVACKRWQLNIGNSGVSERQKVSNGRIASKIGCSRGRDVGCPSKRNSLPYENSQWRMESRTESIVNAIRFHVAALEYNRDFF